MFSVNEEQNAKKNSSTIYWSGLQILYLFKPIRTSDWLIYLKNQKQNKTTTKTAATIVTKTIASIIVNDLEDVLYW